MNVSAQLQRLAAWLETWRRSDERHHGRLDAGLLLLAAGCALAAVVLLSSPGGYHSGFETVHSLLRTLLPGSVWIGITRFGDAGLLLVLSLLLAVRRPDVFLALMVAALLTTLYARGLKIAFDAGRPPDVFAPDVIGVLGPILHGRSFPSGHTASAFVFAGVLWSASRMWGQRLFVMSGALLVGLSRVALGVHWPVDVLAGACGGLLCAAAGHWLAARWHAGYRVPVYLALQLVPLGGLIALVHGSKGNPDAPLPVSTTVLAVLVWVALQLRKALAGRS